MSIMQIALQKYEQIFEWHGVTDLQSSKQSMNDVSENANLYVDHRIRHGEPGLPIPPHTVY